MRGGVRMGNDNGLRMDHAFYRVFPGTYTLTNSLVARELMKENKATRHMDAIYPKRQVKVTNEKSTSKIRVEKNQLKLQEIVVLMGGKMAVSRRTERWYGNKTV